MPKKKKRRKGGKKRRIEEKERRGKISEREGKITANANRKTKKRAWKNFMEKREESWEEGKSRKLF